MFANISILKMLTRSDSLATDTEKDRVEDALDGEICLISKAEAAKILDCSIKTIDRYVKRGHLKTTKLSERKIRLVEHEVRSFARNGTTGREVAWHM